MKTLLTFVLAMGLSTITWAGDHSEHSETVCSEVNTQVCAHIGMHGKIQLNTPTNMMVHFTVDDETAAKISNLSLMMAWSPESADDFIMKDLEFEAKNATHYMVKDAIFEKQGTWYVAIIFDFNGEQDLIEIPLTVE